MGYKGNNLGQQLIGGVAYKAGTKTGAATAGETIVAPWDFGRQILFSFVGILFAQTTLTIKVEGRLRGTSTWETAQKEGADIEIDTDILGGLSAGDYMQGTLDLTRFPGETYDAIRLKVTNTGAGATDLAASYLIGDLYEYPGNSADVLFRIQRYGVQ